jgi:protein arginine kinase activator
MLCDICKKNEAAIRFAEIRKGTLAVRNICEACARTTGIADQLEWTIASLDGAITEAMSGFTGDRAGQAACPSCGMTIEEFRRHGHLGCEHCYDSFAVLLLPLLEQLHPNGRRQDTAGPAVGGAPHSDHRRQAMERRLQEAVAAEEYELAARLRDGLKALAAGGGPRATTGNHDEQSQGK